MKEEKKTHWWYYVLCGLGFSGIIGSWNNYTLEATTAKVISIILIFIIKILLLHNSYRKDLL